MPERSRRPAASRSSARAVLVALALLGAALGIRLAVDSSAPPAAAPRAAVAEPQSSARGSAPRASGASPSTPRRPDRPLLRPQSPPRIIAPAKPVTIAGRVAIIFDDAGQNLEQLQPILSLGRPVVVAVLPGLPASEAVAQRASAAGLEVMLHLPLEADDDARALGPVAVTTSMDDAEIRAQVAAALGSVPGAIGINGHMGSKGTADRRVMKAVIEVARKRGLFFVDSRTSARSVAEEVAREKGVRTARRHVFLDNEEEPEAIEARLRDLIAVARERGEAIAIGHVQRQTAQVLGRLLPEFDRAGVQLVPVSTLVR